MNMTRFGWIGIVTATVLSNIACSTTPTAPSQSPAVTRSTSASVVGPAAGTLTTVAGSCTIDIGTTTRPLPALHELANWINASLSASSLTCGQVNSLAAKLQQEVAKLDHPPQDQNFPAACGASTALLQELEALVRTGQLATLTFPPPVPGAPTTVLGLAGLTNEMFCEAAHG
jgi:hypothetical protein